MIRNVILQTDWLTYLLAFTLQGMSVTYKKTDLTSDSLFLCSAAGVSSYTIQERLFWVA